MRNISILIIIIGLSFIMNQAPLAQINGNTYVSLEAGYLKGIGQIKYTDQVSLKNEGNAYRLRVSTGYYFNSKNSVGLGLGLDGYHQPGYNTVPVYMEYRRYIYVDGNSFNGILNFGYALGVGNTFEKGFMTGIGFGYNKKLNKTFWFKPSIGLNIQRINSGRLTVFDTSNQEFTNIETPILIKSFMLNLALEF